MWRIRDLHIRVERPTSCVNSFLIRLRNNLGKWTHRLIWPLVGSSVFFSPCQAQCGPSLSSGEKWGWACCCDITSWFWNTRKKWKTFTKATGQATRHHTATIIFSFPATLKAQTFSYFYHKKKKTIFFTSCKLWNVSFHKHTFVPLETIIQLKPPEVNRGEMSIQQVSYVMFTWWLGNVWTHLLSTHPARFRDHQV